MDSRKNERGQADLSGHAPFPRPSTAANRLLASALPALGTGRITLSDVERWLESSLQVSLMLTSDAEVLERVRSATTWLVVDEEPPDSDVWSGEVVFSADAPPAAVCYSATLASRLPGSLLEL